MFQYQQITGSSRLEAGRAGSIDYVVSSGLRPMAALPAPEKILGIVALGLAAWMPVLATVLIVKG